MLVDPAVLEQINGKIKRRVLELPVQHGKRFGELKKCPMREKGVYVLTAAVPYSRHRQAAEEQPTVARAVLLLIERCLTPPKTVTVTVMQPPVRQDDRWIVHFEKGDWSDCFDQDLYLSRHNDFTMIASKQTVKGDAPYCPPFAEDLERARRKATERRVSPERAGVRRVRGEAESLVESISDMKARNRVKLAIRELEKSESQLLCSDEQELELSRGGPHPEGDRDVCGSNSHAPQVEAA